MMKKYPLNAVRLRLILSLSLFAIALVTSIAVYFVHGMLRDVAVDVSHVVVDASASQDNIQTLQKIEKKLAEEKDVVKRAGNIVADSQSYQYQNQIINDINDYARRAGIGITNIDFVDSTEKAATPGATGTPAAPAAPAGVKSTYVSVTLQNPAPYDNVLRFIHFIEQNLTKMQISKVGLAKGATGDTVTSEALTIQVYVR